MELDLERTIHQVLSKLIKSSEPSEVLALFLEKLTKIIGADAATLGQWEDNLGFIKLTVNIPENKNIVGHIVVPKKGGLDGRVYRENPKTIPTSTENYNIVPLYRYSKNRDALEKLKELDYSLAVGIPLYYKKKIAATVCFYYQDRLEHIRDEEKTILNEIIDQLEIALTLEENSNKLKHKTKKLNHTQRIFNLLLNFSPDVIIITDLVGNVQNFNKTAERVLGMKAEAVLGKKVPIIEDKEERERFFNIFRDVKEGTQYQGTFRFQGKEGTIIDTVLIPIKDKRDRVESVIISGKDVTERKKLEQKLKNYSIKLLTSKNKIEKSKKKLQKREVQMKTAQKYASIGHLTQKLSHQVNNPLMSVLNHIYLVQDDLKELQDAMLSNPVKSKELIDDLLENTDGIVTESERIKKTIKELREFSAVAKDDTHYRKTDILDVFKKTLKKVEKKFQNLGVNVEVSVKNGLNEAFTLANFREMKMVLESILENAFYAIFYRKGEKTEKRVSIKIGKVKGRKTNFFQISISDNGVGIDQNQMNQLFNPFFSDWPIRPEQKHKHTGMSLAKVQSILDSWECKTNISIMSNPKGGTKFILDFETFEETEEEIAEKNAY